VAKNATTVLALNAPSKIRNSPTNPDVEGKPTDAIVKNMKIAA